MAGSLGSAYVQVFPVMKGFRKSIEAEMSGAGASGSSKLAQAFGKTGGRIGQSLGRDMKRGTDSAMAGLGQSSLEKLSANAKRAESAFSSAMGKARAAAKSAEAAQVKHNEAVAKYGANSSQALRAEASLISAQNRAAQAMATADAKARALGEAQKVLNSATKAATSTAERQVGVLGRAFGKLPQSVQAGLSGIGGQVSSMASGLHAKVGPGLESLKAGFQGTFSAIGQMAATAGTAIAGGIAAGVKQSVAAYAEYEQLVGGVETLFSNDAFGDASAQVMQNSAKAFKTAGMSANQYMETISGFSASLVQGLGGDVQKAAEIGNRAIIDMSDNANKMGTDIGMIQNAYQGFAKQNFSMLDNLKLGYGGSQSEAKRLIQDAAALTDIQSELGVAVDASSMSFDNIANAISVVQKNLGIAGTTAAEATDTIEGSAGMMKASWEDFKVSLAIGDDVSGSFKTFTDSAGIYLDNLVPRVQQVVSSIGGLFSSQLGNLFSGSGIGQSLSGLAPIIGGIAGAVAPLASHLPIVGQAFGMLGGNVTKFMGPAGAVIGLLVAMFANSEQLRNVVGQLLQSFMSTGQSLMTTLQPAFETIGVLIAQVAGLLGDTLAQALQAVSPLFTALGSFISAVLPVISSLISIIAQAVSWLIGKLAPAISSVMSFFNNLSATVVSVMSSFISAVSNGISSAVGFFTSLPGRIRGALAGAGSWLVSVGRNIVEGLTRGIRNAIGNVVSAITGGLSDAIGKAKSFLGIASPSKVMAKQIGRWIPPGIAVGVENATPSMLRSINSSLGEVEQLSYSVPVNWGARVSGLGGMTPNGAGGAGRIVNQTINVHATDPASVAEVIAARQRAALGA